LIVGTGPENVVKVLYSSREKREILHGGKKKGFLGSEGKEKFLRGKSKIRMALGEGNVRPP